MKTQTLMTVRMALMLQPRPAPSTGSSAITQKPRVALMMMGSEPSAAGKLPTDFSKERTLDPPPANARMLAWRAPSTSSCSDGSAAPRTTPPDRNRVPLRCTPETMLGAHGRQPDGSVNKDFSSLFDKHQVPSPGRAGQMGCYTR